MIVLQVLVLVCVFGPSLSHPQLTNSYGVPIRFLNDASFFANRYQQDYPVRPVTHTLALSHPLTPTVQNDQLELLPPLQHVVGTRYPSVDPGPGYRFPLSQLLNPTAPPNLH